jgi:hypothetical protein
MRSVDGVAGLDACSEGNAPGIFTPAAAALAQRADSRDSEERAADA